MNYGSEWPSTHISLLDRVRVPTDAAAWKEFVTIYEPLIYKYCRKRRLNEFDSEDVCQEVFRQISMSFHSFEYNQKLGRFRSWLFTVTYHEICRWYKKNQRFMNQADADSVQVILDQQPGEIDAEWTDEFCSHICKTSLEIIRIKFDDKTWKAFELTWIKDVPSKEVAAELDTDVAWVYKAKFLVQKSLKEEIRRLSFDSSFHQK